MRTTWAAANTVHLRVSEVIPTGTRTSSMHDDDADDLTITIQTSYLTTGEYLVTAECAGCHVNLTGQTLWPTVDESIVRLRRKLRHAGIA